MENLQMGKIACYLVAVVSLVLIFIFFYFILRNGNQKKLTTKEFILEKVECLYKNINSFSKIKLYWKLIELRGLLEHRLRYYTTTEKNDLGLEISVINYDEFPREWQECVDYLWCIFDRRENGPYRDLDLKTLRDITQDVYELLKN